jgi:hypothetical protein
MSSVFASFRSRTPETDFATAARAAHRAPHRGSKQRTALWLGLAVASAIALNLLLSFAVQAGSWTLPETTGTFKVNTSRQSSADNRGLAALDPTRSESFGFKPYIEYGLMDGLTMGLNNETRLVKSSLDGEIASRTDGFMTTQLFLRGRLRDNKDWYMVSVQDLVRLPGQEAPGTADSNLRLQYGRSGTLSVGNWTSSVKTGFQPRLDHAPEKFQADLALGWKPSDRWQLTAQSRNTVGDAEQGSNGQLAISRHLTKALSIQVGGWQTVSGGTGEPHGYDAMVWLRY